MSLLLHIIVTYIKENIITKLQKLYSPARNRRMGNKWPTLFVKKPLCEKPLSPALKLFIERPVPSSYFYKKYNIVSFFFPDISKFLTHNCIKLFSSNNFIWRHQNSMTLQIVLGIFNWSW